MMRTITLPIAAAAAAWCLSASSSHAQYYGTAPWCAVVSVGTGGVHWDCQYNTVEACVPNVLAGNRGFCGRNPYFGHPSNYGSAYASGYGPAYGSGAWQEPPVTPYRHYSHDRHYSRHQPYKHSHKS